MLLVCYWGKIAMEDRGGHNIRNCGHIKVDNCGIVYHIGLVVSYKSM